MTESMLFEAWVLLQKRHVIEGPYREEKPIYGILPFPPPPCLCLSRSRSLTHDSLSIICICVFKQEFVCNCMRHVIERLSRREANIWYSPSLSLSLTHSLISSLTHSFSLTHSHTLSLSRSGKYRDPFTGAQEAARAAGVRCTHET